MAGAIAIVAIAGYVLWTATSVRDSSHIVADAASLRTLMLDVAAAADEAAATGDAQGLNLAIAALDGHRRYIAAETARTLGPDAVAQELADVEEALAGLASAARSYADGSGDVGAGSGAFRAGSASVARLLDALADRGALRLGQLRSAAMAGTVLLLIGGGAAAAGLHSTRRRLRLAQSAGDATTRTLSGLSRAVPDLVYETDAGGVLRFVTEASWALLGRPPDQMVGRPLTDFLVDPAALPAPAPAGPTVAARTATAECDWLYADSSHRRYEVVIRASSAPGGGTRGVVRNISERLEAESALLRAEDRLASVLGTAQNGIMVVDAEGRVLVANPALGGLLGYDAGELCGLNLTELVVPAVLDQTNQLMAAPMWSGDAVARERSQLLRRDGKARDVELSISTYRLPGDAPGVLVEVDDITDALRSAEQIRRMADYDELTALPNRAHFERAIGDTIASASASQQEFAVLLIDLDRFKLVNDTQGHATGDALLREFAGRLRERFPERDMVARFGGDVFLVLLPAIDTSDDATRAATAINVVLDAPLVASEREYHLSASVGVALFPDDGEDAETLLRYADSAMYRAKELGGKGYQFANPAPETTLHGRLAMEVDLRRAVERHEFVVYYQPLVDAVTAEIRAFEALIRWEHPTQGLIPPSAFVELLEATGLIVEVGEWVMSEACTQNRRWQLAGLPPVSMAVNLSAHQLLNANLIDVVRRVLHDTELDPQYLELEVTETTAGENMDVAVHIVRELRELGVSVAIDDFGTGHSSLSRLRELPVTTLKIDRSFVTAMTNDEDARVIVTGVIALGHALGLTVVAEGVETQDQLDMLRTFGRDILQGYLFARPLPEDASCMLLAEGVQAGSAA